MLKKPRRESRLGQKDRRDSKGVTLTKFRRDIRKRAGPPPSGYLVTLEFTDDVDDGSMEWHQRRHKWIANIKRTHGKSIEIGFFESLGKSLAATVEACRKATKRCEERYQKNENDHYDPPPHWIVGGDPIFDARKYVIDGQWMALTDAHRLYSKHQFDQNLDAVPLDTFRRDIFRDHVRHKKGEKPNGAEACLVHIESLNRYLLSKGRDGEGVLVLPFKDGEGNHHAKLEDALALCLEYVDMLRVNVPNGINNQAEFERLHLASSTAHKLLGSKYNPADAPVRKKQMNRLYGNE